MSSGATPATVTGMPTGTGTVRQAVPFQCRTTAGPAEPASPKAHTSLGPKTAASRTVSGPAATLDMVHAEPFHRSAYCTAVMRSGRTGKNQVSLGDVV